MEMPKKRNTQQPPRVFGPDSALHRTIDLQDQTIRSLIAIVSDGAEAATQETLKQLLHDYTTAKQAIEDQKEKDIFNGRGDHAMMDAYLDHRSTGDVRVPFPAKENSAFPTLERLIARILVPRANELFFTPEARSDPQSKSGVYSLTTRSFILVLADEQGHMTKMDVRYGRDITVTVMESTCGNCVFLRSNVETMIQSFFDLLDQIGIFQEDDEKKSSEPVKAERLKEILRANLPGIFGQEDDDTENGLRVVCVPPLDAPDKMIRSLTRHGAELRVTSTSAKDIRQQSVFTMLVDEDTYLKVTPCARGQRLEVMHFSSTERHWVSVKDHFPYIPQEIFYRLLSLFFKHHHHEPLKMRREEKES